MITKNFSFIEFGCRCRTCSFADGYQIDKGLVLALQEIRDFIGEPMVVTSGLRCYDHNKKVNGVSDSYHKTGLAADIACTGSTARYKIVKKALTIGLTVGINKSFIHIDKRPVPKLFLY